MSEECDKIHQWANSLKRFRFPFKDEEIPKNGVYILFEEGEFSHGKDKIARIGTHTGQDQLRSRLKQHFINENKDRSIFRKNIGRCILNKNKDPFLKLWEIDLTTQKAKKEFSKLVDKNKLKEIEKQVTSYLQNHFTFAVINVPNKEDRLKLEAKMISTISLCKDCKPSPKWLGLHSPKEKIKQSGLWLVNELYKEPLTSAELSNLKIYSKSSA